jgi:hypothetical protein
LGGGAPPIVGNQILKWQRGKGCPHARWAIGPAPSRMKEPRTGAGPWAKGTGGQGTSGFRLQTALKALFHRRSHRGGIARGAPEMGSQTHHLQALF